MQGVCVCDNTSLLGSGTLKDPVVRELAHGSQGSHVLITVALVFWKLYILSVKSFSPFLLMFGNFHDANRSELSGNFVRASSGEADSRARHEACESHCRRKKNSIVTGGHCLHY